MIQVDQLTKAYDDLSRGRFVAVDQVSFSIGKGEIFGLLGPNGAGKTTVLRILSTVLAPTSGTATVAGHDVKTDPAAVRRNIGFVSNNTAIYDRMDCMGTGQLFRPLTWHVSKAARFTSRNTFLAVADE